MASSPFNTNYKVYVDPNASNGVQLVGYKGATAFDAAAFYAPYVPLTMSGAMPIPDPTLVIESREGQGGWWAGVAVILVEGRNVPAKPLEDIHIWCVEQWGAPQLAEMGGRWFKDRDLIFVHDERMLVDLKVRWHGVTVQG